jgi:hypothetical protein
MHDNAYDNDSALCVSVVHWGEAEPLAENWILVGGKRLPIRKNLLDFL